jgi:hypothetical protein
VTFRNKLILLLRDVSPTHNPVSLLVQYIRSCPQYVEAEDGPWCGEKETT